jgi:hypothetical protein
MLAALSVDLDEVPCYAAILAASARRRSRAHAIYHNALPRGALCDQPASAPRFAIGSDLGARAAQAIARLHAAGHEIGNHSFHRRYDLTRMPRDVIREDIEASMAALTAVLMSARWARAPGYVVSDAACLRIARRVDSSIVSLPTTRPRRRSPSNAGRRSLQHRRRSPS